MNDYTMDEACHRGTVVMFFAEEGMHGWSVGKLEKMRSALQKKVSQRRLELGFAVPELRLKEHPTMKSLSATVSKGNATAGPYMTSVHACLHTVYWRCTLWNRSLFSST